MTFGAGDSPFLKREVITPVIRSNVSALLDEFPVYTLFTGTSGGTPRMVAGEISLLDIDYQEKRKADLHAQPGLADRFIHTRYGQLMVRVLYEQIKDCIRPNELAQLRMPGQSSGLAPAAAEVLTKIDTIVERGTRTILRAREQDCCSMLSSASYTRTVDGVANTVTTGLSLLAAPYVTANWATASTDIVGDIGAMLEAHVDQAGEDPTACVISFRQAKNIARNDKVRALLNGNGLPSGGDLGLEGVISRVFAACGAPGVSVTIHKAHYKNGSGTKTYYWAEDRLTLASLQNGQDVLGYVTAPIILADGSLSTDSISPHQWVDNETGEHWIKLQGVGAPYLGDVDKITLYDLTP
jgi:hypothetical protein